MANTRLSHSAVTKFQSCPKSYEFHYIDRIRPKNSSAALLFGSAVDVAVTALVNPADVSKRTPEEIFVDTWTIGTLNSLPVFIPTCTDIVYSDSDGDKDLLTKEAIKDLETKYTTGWEHRLDDVIKRKKTVGFNGLSKDDKIILNEYNWHCLHRKGLLMVDAVRTQILPKIQTILGTQVEVALENSEGDKVTGFADMVCTFEGYAEPIVFDFKTSSIDYEHDSVLTSPQLSLYVHALSDKYNNTRNAGYIVLHKRIIKNKTKVCGTCSYDGTGHRHATCNNIVNEERCNGEWIEAIAPEVRIQVIVSEVPKLTEDLVLQNIDEINTAIKQGTFIRNLGSCMGKFGKCPYFNKCYLGSDEGLVKVE